MGMATCNKPARLCQSLPWALPDASGGTGTSAPLASSGISMHEVYSWQRACDCMCNAYCMCKVLFCVLSSVSHVNWLIVLSIFDTGPLYSLRLFPSLNRSIRSEKVTWLFCVFPLIVDMSCFFVSLCCCCCSVHLIVVVNCVCLCPSFFCDPRPLGPPGMYPKG